MQEGHLRLNELNRECKKIKKMTKVKQTFAKELGVEHWEDAVEAYPQYADERYCLIPKCFTIIQHLFYSALQRFVPSTSNLSGSALAALQQYCRKAMQSTAGSSVPANCPEETQVVKVTNQNGPVFGFNLAMKPMDITYHKISSMILNFPGLQAVIFKFDSFFDQQVRY